MPTYKFLDKNTKKTWTEFMGITEADEYLAANPHVERLVNGAPIIGYNTVMKKPDGWFRDKLSEIKKQHRGNTIGKNSNDWGVRGK